MLLRSFLKNCSIPNKEEKKEIKKKIKITLKQSITYRNKK